MEDLLGRIAAQSVSFAIKSGITVVSSFAIREGSRYLRTIKGKDRDELQRLQYRLEQKINIISPAIDLIEIISARGNSSLESAVSLTKALRYDIQQLGQRLANAASQSENKLRKRTKEDIKAVIDDIRNMLNRIEDAIPLINLAVTTSGANLSASLPHTVSPSRLLQASTFLSAGDTAYGYSPFSPSQIGPSFNLTLYMCFAGHSHRKENLSAKDLTWQEVISKCRVKLVRSPLVFDDEDEPHAADDEWDMRGNLSAERAMRAQNKIDEFCYELCLIEDLDDGRVHEAEEGKEPPGPFEDVQKAGIRARIPIHQMTKIFYTNSGKLLGIDEANSPILLIKRDKNATAPRNLLERIRRYDYDDGEYNDDDYETEYGLGGSEGNTGDHHVEEDLESEGYEFPKHLDPEWYAFEVWQEPVDDPDNDPDDGEDDEDDRNELNQAPAYSSNKYENKLDSVQPKLSQLTLQESSLTHHGTGDELTSTLHLSNITVKSSLSLLECLLRLSCLQNYQQCSHLSVSDELLNLYLQDGNSWLGSQETREREREYAKQRIGFDPFASPQSGEEEVRGVTGTPRQTERINRISNSQTRSPIARSPIRHPVPRGRVLLPITPKNPASTRSDSPGAQLRLESASKSDKNNAISRSYPSTPVPLSKIDGRHESGDSISSRKWGDYIGDNQHNSVKRNEQASWLRR